MRIKLDENLPASLVDVLSQFGHDVDTVPLEGLAGRADPEIWYAAQEAGRFFITQDLDFSDARVLSPGTHHDILLVRLRDSSRRMLLERIRQVYQAEDAGDWAGCFVVATECKVRVRKPVVGK